MSHVIFQLRGGWILAPALAVAFLFPLPVRAQQTRPAQTQAAPADQGEPVPPNVRDSIDKALEWLAKDQQPDGNFNQGKTGGTTTIPSLAVLAFLARGYTPGKDPYGENINRSIDYVLASQQKTGLLSGDKSEYGMYDHGISALMLAEAYAKVNEARRAKIGKALAGSTRLILDAQQPTGHPKNMPYTGGWRYHSDSNDSDISVTGWQMMALRGAQQCGIVVPRGALEAARDYIKRSALPTGGFSYQPGSATNQARTGTGILMMELFRDPTLKPGEHPKEALAGGDYLMANPPNNRDMEFYYYQVYYCSHALDHLGGKYWEFAYLRKLRPTLLKQQAPDGQFEGGVGMEQRAGPAYRTAMACLALCVPYRNLPVYENDK